MEGRVAMVTGALSGIGLGVARCLGHQGCLLLLTDLPALPHSPAVLADLDRDFPGRVQHVAADLRDRGQVRQLCQQADSLFPQGIHILVNVAGWGRIINVSSGMAVVSAPGKAPYSAVKAGLVGLNKGVALEAASSGVTCNDVCPGYVDTPMFQAQMSRLAQEKGISYDEAQEKVCREYIPTGKLMSVEEVASMVHFLCTEGAINMTGSAILMDAGYTSR